MVFGRELRGELSQQRQDVLPPFAERGDGQCNSLDAVEKIRAERPAFNIVFDRSERRAHEPNVGLNLRRSTDAHEATVFEKSQEFRLHWQPELADLIQEQRPACGGLDLASRELVCTGEGAALVTEEFGLEQVFGNGSAVDRHERLRATRRMLVHTTREHLLAAAAFADQAHDHVLGGNLAEYSIEAPHGGRRHDGLDKYVDFALLRSHRREGYVKLAASPGFTRWTASRCLACTKHADFRGWRAACVCDVALRSRQVLLNQKVIVVSDNRETLDSVQPYLERAGATVRCVSRAEKSADSAWGMDAVLFFADDFPRPLALEAFAALRALRPTPLLVVVTEDMGAFADGPTRARKARGIVMLPRPAWGWMLVDAIRVGVARASGGD